MSKARGLITGGDFESRSSGMYDSVDNVRIAAISQAGLKKVGMEQTNLYTTGLTTPQGFAWSPDGLHLYITYSGDFIKHIQCTSPFNTSGSSEQAIFNCAPYETSTYSLEVSPNGRYLYFGGTGRDTINQFTMGTPWTITTSANDNLANRLVPGYEQIGKRLDNIFGIGSADASVRGFEFNNDGTKLYLIGFGDDNIQQFSLSTAYDVGTLDGYNGAYSLGGDGLTTPYSLRWNNDGTKFFVVDYGTDAVVEYSVSNAYDVTSGTITEGTNFTTTSYESNPYDVGFNADGTQMFVIGNGSDQIHEWTLSTGFDLSSTVTYISGTSLGTLNPAHFDFNPDGTKLVVIDYDADTVREYDLSTGFDSSTATLYTTLDLSPAQWDDAPTGTAYLTNYFATPSGCRFNGNGTTITFLDRFSSSYDKAVSIPLTTAYELSSFADGCIDLTARASDFPVSFRFNSDGTKCYVLDGTDDRIYQWSLATPYVLGRGLTVMTYDGVSSSLTSSDPALKGFDFTPDGKAIFTCGNSTDTIGHFTLSTPFDVTSTVTFMAAIDTTSFESVPEDVRVVNTPNGYKLHFLGSGSDKIFEMDINF
jgi:hypothetical protein